MKKNLAIACLSISLLSSFPVYADQVFGTRPKLTNALKISQILDQPEKYLGKTLRVEGIAMDVCPTRGCWMKIQSDRKKEHLLIKVNDGEMVFPMSARGKHTIIEGKLIKRTMPIKEVQELEAARAKKSGEKFDPASITKPRVMYMFQPSGVIIQDAAKKP